jgi:hypothetical protein
MGAMATRTCTVFAIAMAAAMAGRVSAQSPNPLPHPPALDAYLAQSGGTVIPAGEFEIDGQRIACGAAPTVLDSGLATFGISAPGFIVLNPKRLTGLPTPLKLFIFSHECAHQTTHDETRADCLALQRGTREGWLTADGFGQICAFLRPWPADARHRNGVERCELMWVCLHGRIAASPRH